MMSDDMLSQDEIDALLRGGSNESEKDQEDELIPEMNVEDYLDSFEQDALGEIGNISFGSSATALSSLLNQKVEITTPAVSIIERKNIQKEFPHPYVAIQVQYTDGFTGANLLVIEQTDAAIIADLMLGGNGENPNPELGEIQLSAVQEAMNQMMGSAATSMSTIFHKRVDISPPTIELMDLVQGEGGDPITELDLIVKISFKLQIGKLIDSNIMQLLPLPFAKGLVMELMNPPQQEEVTLTHQETSPIPSTQAVVGNEEMAHSQIEANEQANVGQQMPNQTAPVYNHAPQQMGSSMQPTTPHHFGGNATQTQIQQPVHVQPASFANFEQPSIHQMEARNFNMLLDIPLQVTVELGRTKRSVEEILELTSGSIIELDKLAGEPVDILVNSRLIAKGEVVVIDENFGVRITDIMSQRDRIHNLNNE
ncbi:flagellar motor switch protein FliN/FliY [Oikeobacillus pervagus]|uniref:Flagellar motor switch protein FliN/FliY n=1 Tax=Oikeobacillus pervagus TaxID=1325931 RepID=A0AAJ1WFS8_9BACI|nr:flagellar motor switch phosphatase FliY [Oikeobacillus pervagus]MDQ0214292.1 flagellar motor switch protein FliN/FliY [Oikeobacillus pervagus]